MDEKEMSQIFSEAMRLYAERIRQNLSLGPFKKILNGEPAIVQVSLNNTTLVVDEVQKPEPVKNEMPTLESPTPTFTTTKPIRKHTEQ